jgi:hypothetical protein
MTSAINPTTISTTFPIAGQDNDSQGFRDNFAAIESNFVTAAEEITALQTVAVTVADIDTQGNPVVNNLLGSTLRNGLYQEFSGTLGGASGVSSARDIDLQLGAVHNFTLSSNVLLTFKNWPFYPGRSVYSNAIVMVSSQNGTTQRTPSFATLGGQIVYDVSLDEEIDFNVTNTVKVIEAWTVNAGNTVYIRLIGEYAA